MENEISYSLYLMGRTKMFWYGDSKAKDLDKLLMTDPKVLFWKVSLQEFIPILLVNDGYRSTIYRYSTKMKRWTFSAMDLY